MGHSENVAQENSQICIKFCENGSEMIVTNTTHQGTMRAGHQTYSQGDRYTDGIHQSFGRFRCRKSGNQPGIRHSL